MKILVLIISVFSLNILCSQTSITLTYEDFIAQVMENHPVAYQANIQNSIGERGVIQAKGAFDPKLFGEFNQKYFDNKQYYSQFKAGIKIPTWFGITAEAGYTNNDGVYLNPQNRLPDIGLWYAGLKLDLGNGLIMNQRRATLKKAQLGVKISESQRKMILNELRRDASIAYFKWLEKHQKVEVYRNAIKNAQQRFGATKKSVLFGDKAEIDTVEAKLTLQKWQTDLLQIENEFSNAEIKLELYLWLEGFAPFEIENTIPSSQGLTPQANIIELDSIVENHPYLTANELKLEQNKIDLKLKREGFKPTASLKYNTLFTLDNKKPVTDFSISNYSWGAELSYPILSRKARSSVKIAKLKIQDQELENKMVQQKIKANILTKKNSYLNSIEQIELKKQLVKNFKIMYDSERTLFDLGESSIFMINSRESKWLKSKLELIEIEKKSRELKAILDYNLMRF